MTLRTDAGLYERVGKRVFDFCVALLSIVVLAPVFAFIGFMVLLTMGRPALFRQFRPGRGGEPFSLMKFRTMRNARREQQGTLHDEERLTAFGRLLRRTSLDELPELWNVIRGDMSLVGPRPLLMEYLKRYSPEQARRHQVRPGITGWAQVHGRNLLTWEEKFERDVWYVDHLTFLIDLRVLAMTLVKVFRGEAISAPGHATMPEFRGTSND